VRKSLVNRFISARLDASSGARKIDVSSLAAEGDWLGVAVAERGSRLPFTRGSALLMIGVLVTGLLSSVIAMRAATRMPLLASLRSE